MIAVVRPNHLDLIQLEGPIADRAPGTQRPQPLHSKRNTQRNHSNPAAIKNIPFPSHPAFESPPRPAYRIALKEDVQKSRAAVAALRKKTGETCERPLRK